MRKRTSRRRWKARALRGQWVPLTAIVEHKLQGPWTALDPNTDVYTRADILSVNSVQCAIQRLKDGPWPEAAWVSANDEIVFKGPGWTSRASFRHYPTGE